MYGIHTDNSVYYTWIPDAFRLYYATEFLDLRYYTKYGEY